MNHPQTIGSAGLGGRREGPVPLQEQQELCVPPAIIDSSGLIQMVHQICHHSLNSSKVCVHA